MDLLEKMNALIDYIDANLATEIDYKVLAHMIGCSEYHLSRMFPFITGQGLALYIRRRRMSQAALELQNCNDIMQIAIKYGYSSVDAFSRAFREIHGVPPSYVWSGNNSVLSFPKLTFSIQIQGAEAMTYRILNKESFTIVGISRNVPIVFSGPNKDIDDMWQSLAPDMIKKLKALSNIEPTGMISVSTNFSEGRMSEEGTLDHYIGVATTNNETEHGFSTLHVESGDWAIFEAVGDFPNNLQSVWGRIYSEWFPSSEYELRKGPEILWNEGPDTSKPNFKSEIWIPVILKHK